MAEDPQTNETWVFALRLEPGDRPGALWHTLWFEDDARKLLVADGRIHWVADPARLAAHVPPGYVVADAEPAVCNVPHLLAVAMNPAGATSALRFLGDYHLLDDVDLAVTTCRPELAAQLGDRPRRRFDAVFRALMEGADVAAAVALGGGSAEVTRSIVATLGRILVSSRFDAT